MIFEGRLFAEIGVQGSPTAPRAPKLGKSERAVVSSGPLAGARGPLWASIGRLPSALVAPVASEGSSGARFGRQRPRGWCPQRTAQMWLFVL